MDGIYTTVGYNYSEYSMAVTTIIFLFAGYFEGGMDWLQFRLTPLHEMYKSMFWNPMYSWRNKWKNLDPSQGEAFWQSSRLLVCLTDGWHLLKMLRNLCIFVGLLHIAICDITIFEAILTVIMCRIFYGLGFSTTFSWIHKI